MAESDLHHFTSRLMHSSEVQNLAIQTAYSYPIPLVNHHVAVYAYDLIGLPPNNPKVSAPTWYIEAVYPSAQIVLFRSFSAGDLRVPLADGETLGPVFIPPEYLVAGADDFNRREEKFRDVYSHSLSCYISGVPLDQASARQVLAELPVFAKKPLIPLFRATNPDFFSWLERNASR